MGKNMKEGWNLGASMFKSGRRINPSTPLRCKETGRKSRAENVNGLPQPASPDPEFLFPLDNCPYITKKIKICFSSSEIDNVIFRYLQILIDFSYK